MDSGYDVRIQRSIVLVLGNGFDLDLGLRTSYKDFWESQYCPKDYPAPLIKHLNAKWPDSLDKVKWYDLENELLEYFRAIKEEGEYPDLITESEREFLKYYNPNNTSCRSHYERYQSAIDSLHEKNLLDLDIGWRLYMTIPYLEDLRQSGVWRDRKAFQLIKDGLCKYITEVSNRVSDTEGCAFNVLFAIARAKELGDYVNIYTFNYTKLHHPYGSNLTNITHHVHGTCEDGKIIIGTQDSKEFNRDYDFLQKSFDPNFNPPALVYDLLNANEIVFFGHSIGVNDRQYFKSFFKQQTSTDAPKRKRITIFTRDEKSEVEIKRSLQEMTDHNLSTLYGMNDLEIIKTAEVKQSPKQFRDFMLRNIMDDAQVRITMQQLLEHL